MRQQGHLGHHAEAAHLLGRQYRHLGNLFGARIGIDIGVADEHRALGQHQHVHGIEVLHAGTATDHLIDIIQMQGMRTKGATDHAVGLAAMDHHRADQRQAATHLDLGVLHRHTAALRETEILFPVFAIARIRFRIDQIEIDPSLHAQAELGHPLFHHRRTTDDDGTRQVLVDHHLHCTQHPLLFTFGIDDAPTRPALGSGEQGLHRQPRVIDKLL